MRAQRFGFSESFHSNGSLAIHRTQQWTHGFASPPYDGFAHSETKSADPERLEASRDEIVVRLRGHSRIARTNSNHRSNAEAVKRQALNCKVSFCSLRLSH